MERRRAVLALPGRLTGLGPALAAAAELVKATEEEAEQATAALDAREREELDQTLTGGLRGVKARHAAGALKDLTEQQSLRAKRFQRDGLDRALTELTGFYRDVLVVQTGAGVAPLNADVAAAVTATAGRSTPETTIRRLDAILECRQQLERNVAPLLALEALLVALI